MTISTPAASPAPHDGHAVLTEAAHRAPLDVRLVVALAGGRDLNAREQQMMDKLQAERGESLYSDMLYAMTHHTFPTRQAKTLWAEIGQHRQSLSNKLGRDIGITLAAHDYLSNVSGVLRGLTMVEENTFRSLATAASRDGLTGLYDKTTFGRLLAEQMALQARHKRACTLVAADIDHFKKLNDTHGHADGDIVLAQVAHIIAQHCRASDIPGRVGGEEFSVILPEVDAAGGQVFAERVRAAVETYFADTPYKVTLSLGVASTIPHGGAKLVAEQDTLVRRADTALYASKNAGRNQVSVLSE